MLAHFAKGVSVAVLVFAGMASMSASEAQSLDQNFKVKAHVMQRREILASQLTVNQDRKSYSFGTVRDVIRRLKQSGHDCRLGGLWDSGAIIDCGPPKDPGILISFTYTKYVPEDGSVNSIRAKGINGGELPASEWIPYLTDLTKFPARPAR